MYAREIIWTHSNTIYRGPEKRQRRRSTANTTCEDMALSFPPAVHTPLIELLRHTYSTSEWDVLVMFQIFGRLGTKHYGMENRVFQSETKYRMGEQRVMIPTLEVVLEHYVNIFITSTARAQSWLGRSLLCTQLTLVTYETEAQIILILCIMPHTITKIGRHKAP